MYHENGTNDFVKLSMKLSYIFLKHWLATVDKNYDNILSFRYLLNLSNNKKNTSPSEIE